MDLPRHVSTLIIGAGVHGLSTGWHLAQELRARGKGADDVLIVDKTDVASGASGIACGVIRNFYYQPAMGAIMRESVDLWHSDPEAFHFHDCGYIALVPEGQDDDVSSIYERQVSEGYRSTLVRGEANVFDYMRGMFPDWRARGQTSLLHEHESGFAFNKPAMQGLAGKASDLGVRIAAGVHVTRFHRDQSGAVRSVDTNRGSIEVDQVVLAAGPWIKNFWTELGLPATLDVRDPEGNVHEGRPMWTYWRLQEGEIRIDPATYVTADGAIPPVFHFDSREPLVSLKTGDILSDELWGTYWKQDANGVQGGAAPEKLGTEAEVDPYGPDSPHYTVKEDFVDLWTSSLSHAMERFENCHHHYHDAPSGGIGCFTPDNFPVFDFAPGIENLFVVADSNHGFKMMSVGKQVARVMMGGKSEALHPFRYARFAEGDLHPVSNSPYIWG